MVAQRANLLGACVRDGDAHSCARIARVDGVGDGLACADDERAQAPLSSNSTTALVESIQSRCDSWRLWCVLACTRRAFMGTGRGHHACVALLLCLCTCALWSCRNDRVTQQSPERASTASSSPAPSLMFGVAVAPASDAATSSNATASIVTFREKLAPAVERAPLDAQANQQLARAAKALSAHDLPQALEAATAAAQLAPDRLEPLEVLLLVRLAGSDGVLVRDAVARIIAADPSNAIALAFAGLTAMRQRDFAGALGKLSWFVGPDAIVRRGAAIPLPTAARELELKAAVCALRVGAYQAAIDAIDATLLISADDVLLTRAFTVLRCDALSALGRDDEALSALSQLRVPSDDGDAIPMLVALRMDRIHARRNDRTFALVDAAEQLALAPKNEFALWRLLEQALDDSPVAARHRARDAQRRALLALEKVSVREASSLRMDVARACLRDMDALHALPEALVRDASDRVAVRAACRVLWQETPSELLPAVCAVIAQHPNEVDSATRAMLASGITVDEALAQLAQRDLGPSSDALRSRIYAQFGFSEEAFAIADAARARDRASQSALAACALAAAELDDETLLLDIDDDAMPFRGVDGDAHDGARPTIARTLAAAWLALERFDLAFDRASEATRDASGAGRALMIQLLAERHDPKQARNLGEALAMLAHRDDDAAADAWARAAEIAHARALEDGETGESASKPRLLPPRNASTHVLLRAARFYNDARVPLAAECIALAYEMDSDTARDAALAELESQPNARVWCERLLADAPALASRRRMAIRALPAVETVAIPAQPLSARFDARVRALEQSLVNTESAQSKAASELVARDALAQSKLRPTTPASIAAVMSSMLALGMNDEARAQLESVASTHALTIPPRVVQTLLAHTAHLAQRDDSHAAQLQACAQVLITRLVRARVDDMLAAMRVAIATGADSAAMQQCATLLARAARPMTLEELPEFGQLFAMVMAIDSDPYPSALLASALAADERFSTEVRGWFGNASVALLAAAGASETEIVATVVRLFEAGTPACLKPDEPMISRAQALLRAANVASMIGDERGSEALLRAAVEADASLPEALNNLAFAAIGRGDLSANTIDLAQRAARASPDEPSILDTLGCVRYHQGRFRDDADGAGAIALFRSALRIRPNDPSLATLDHLGDALWRDGDQQGAVRVWQQVPTLANLRYPPAALARNLAQFQQREFGLELVMASELIRRLYGDVVTRVEHKLQEVARGQTPSVAPCHAARERTTENP